MPNFRRSEYNSDGGEASSLQILRIFSNFCFEIAAILMILEIFHRIYRRVGCTDVTSITNHRARKILSKTSLRLPPALGNWKDIVLFERSDNEIIGSMPESASSWVNMKGFSVFTNQLSGSIPSFVSQCSHLQFFAVYDNKLTNTIPEDIGILVNATNFALSMNLLTGTLPPSIGRMTTLLSFYVNDNLLTGTIPSSIGNWSQIEMAYFGTNQFTVPGYVLIFKLVIFFRVTAKSIVLVVPKSACYSVPSWTKLLLRKKINGAHCGLRPSRNAAPSAARALRRSTTRD
jgi:hypothetical protein